MSDVRPHHDVQGQDRRDLVDTSKFGMGGRRHINASVGYGRSSTDSQISTYWP